MQKATIKDVAREAGVSVATASNALNNPDIVRPETRARVLAAAKTLDYVPNINGKRLRMQATKTIGLFVNAMTGEYYGAFADSMYRVCHAKGYELQISIVSDVQSIYNKLNDHTIDGAVVFMDAVNQKAAEAMIAINCPLVFLAIEACGAHVSSILYESKEHGRMAADYLFGLGRRNMMHVFGIPGNYDSEMRFQGFVEELDKHGIGRQQISVISGLFERAAAYREMRKYLTDGNPVPDAVFAANDLSAIGCINALTEAGYSVPEQVSVLGCDDITLCEYITPSLSTIRTHFAQTGTCAAEEILRLIQGEEGRVIRQEGALVVRHSCAIKSSETL